MIKIILLLPFLTVSVVFSGWLAFKVFNALKTVKMPDIADFFKPEKYLTEFEIMMLAEMDKPEMWEMDSFTIEHKAGFQYWITNTHFFCFNAYQSCFKANAPEISGFIAKFMLWHKATFSLIPALAAKESKKTEAAKESKKTEAAKVALEKATLLLKKSQQEAAK